MARPSIDLENERGKWVSLKPMLDSFNYLYHFESSTHDLVEIRRLDRPTSASPSEIYKWLLIPKCQAPTLEFEFVETEKQSNKEFRQFKNAHLEFDHNSATLMIFSKKFHFRCSNSLDRTELLSRKISVYLKESDDFSKYKHAHHSFRSIHLSDFNTFLEWVQNQEVIRFSLTRLHELKTDHDYEQWFLDTLLSPKSFTIGICALTGEMIGYTGLCKMNSVDKNAEFFILIGNTNYWGKGIATHCAKFLIEKSFRDFNLHRVFLTASSKNPGALRAYEKAGFVYEGTMKEAFYREGEYSDKVFMGKVNSHPHTPF